MIEFRNVSKSYSNGVFSLDQVDFKLNHGEIAFLTGHSGAGKTTLIKLIIGMEKASSGSVVVSGHNVGLFSRQTMPYFRRNIGLVFQDHQLLYDRNVFQNIAMPLIIAGYTEKNCVHSVRAALEMVGLLEKENAMPSELSGGQKQRVGLARAIVNRPALIVADEPTGNLDPDLSREVMQLFDKFNQTGVTVLIASHDLSLLTKMNHRMLTLDHGMLVSDREVTS